MCVMGKMVVMVAAMVAVMVLAMVVLGVLDRWNNWFLNGLLCFQSDGLIHKRIIVILEVPLWLKIKFLVLKSYMKAFSEYWLLVQDKNISGFLEFSYSTLSSKNRSKSGLNQATEVVHPILESWDQGGKDRTWFGWLWIA